MARPNRQLILIISISFMGIVISFKAVSAIEAKAEEGLEEQNKIEYKSEGLKDPFEEEKIEKKEEPKKEASAKPLPNLQIEGMVWGGSFPQAIINNKVVRIGDTIEGVQISDINKSGVNVLFDNRQYTLTVSASKNPQGSKKP